MIGSVISDRDYKINQFKNLLSEALELNLSNTATSDKPAQKAKNIEISKFMLSAINNEKLVTNHELDELISFQQTAITIESSIKQTGPIKKVIPTKLRLLYKHSKESYKNLLELKIEELNKKAKDLIHEEPKTLSLLEEQKAPTFLEEQKASTFLFLNNIVCQANDFYFRNHSYIEKYNDLIQDYKKFNSRASSLINEKKVFFHENPEYFSLFAKDLLNKSEFLKNEANSCLNDAFFFTKTYSYLLSVATSLTIIYATDQETKTTFNKILERFSNYSEILHKTKQTLLTSKQQTNEFKQELFDETSATTSIASDTTNYSTSPVSQQEELEQELFDETSATTSIASDTTNYSTSPVSQQEELDLLLLDKKLEQILLDEELEKILLDTEASINSYRKKQTFTQNKFISEIFPTSNLESFDINEKKELIEQLKHTYKLDEIRKLIKNLGYELTESGKGSHMHYKLKFNPNKFIVLPSHKSDLKIGTRNSIIKLIKIHFNLTS